MVANYSWSNFSLGKFKSSALVELVGDLAGNFNRRRFLYDEKEVWR